MSYTDTKPIKADDMQLCVAHRQFRSTKDNVFRVFRRALV